MLKDEEIKALKNQVEAYYTQEREYKNKKDDKLKVINTELTTLDNNIGLYNTDKLAI
jgi:hypothetical protein